LLGAGSKVYQTQYSLINRNQAFWGMATILDKMGHLGDLANHLTEVQLQAALAFNNLRVLRRWANFLFITRSPERIESVIYSESNCSMV
jgi:hypothetical protein